MATGGTNHSADIQLEALNLPEKDEAAEVKSSQDNTEVSCLLCSLIFNVEDDKNPFLKHLIEEHKLIIADVNLICDFAGYIAYWKMRFSEQPIMEEFCSVIRTNCKPDDPDKQEDFYLLSDVLKEDKGLREFLQRRRLNSILRQLQEERDDVTFKRRCLFCREEFEGNRSTLIDHLTKDHSFAIGRSDNIVFVNEFLEKLQEKLDKLQCLYCERTFRDWTTLKDHMRKKQHKKINPKNKEYDKYYVINYLEMGKNWETVMAEDDKDLAESESNDTDNWEDWDEDATSNIVCLFCSYNSSEMSVMLSHMTEVHTFDLDLIKKTLDLNFYHQIKLINFIRREMHRRSCFICQEKFPAEGELYAHMKKEKHISEMPDRKVWDQPQYFFPTYENDTLLCVLEDDDDNNEQSTVVLAEDIKQEIGNLEEGMLLLNLIS